MFKATAKNLLWLSWFTIFRISSEVPSNIFGHIFHNILTYYSKYYNLYELTPKLVSFGDCKKNRWYARGNTGERSKSVNGGNPTDSSSLSITERHADILLMLIYSLIRLSRVFWINKVRVCQNIFLSLSIQGGGVRRLLDLKKSFPLLLLCNHIFYCLVDCTAHICCIVCSSSQGKRGEEGSRLGSISVLTCILKYKHQFWSIYTVYYTDIHKYTQVYRYTSERPWVGARLDN